MAIFSVFFNMKVFYVFSLESPDQYKKENRPKIIQNLQLWIFCSKELKNEFETAVVNEPSVFEPLKFYCNYIMDQRNNSNLTFAYRLFRFASPGGQTPIIKESTLKRKGKREWKSCPLPPSHTPRTCIHTFSRVYKAF